MPQKRTKRNYQNDIKVNAIVSKYSEQEDIAVPDVEADVPEAEFELDSSALNSSVQSGASDIEDVSRIEKPKFTPNLTENMSFKTLTNQRTVIGLKHEEKFYFKGKILLKVLAGRLEILGYSMTASSNSDFVEVFSPRGYSLLYCQGFKDHKETDAHDKLLDEGLESVDAENLHSDCIIVIKKHEADWCRYLSENINKNRSKMNLLNRDFKNLPQEIQNDGVVADVEKLLDINLVSPIAEYSRMFQVGEDWSLATQSIDWSLKNNITPKVVVAGGKGVGKSTFLRWLTNKIVSQSPVVLLDLDPGQAELSIPGYLSVSLLTKPLLGPNFSHIGSHQTQLLVCLGDLSPGNCPHRFHKILTKLLDYIKTNLSSYPLLVNTMGWCNGVGLMLLVDTIRLLQPTTVIQLNSKFPRKNFPYSLTPGRISNTKDKWRSDKVKLNYNLLEMNAVPESNSAKDMRSKDYWGLPDPRMLRDMVMLSWLGKTGWEWPVYKMHMSSVTLGVANGKVSPEALLSASNSVLVDLCHVRDTEKCRPASRPELYSVTAKNVVKPSLGVGFIRNIDLDQFIIYLATYVPVSDLADVNCLLIGQLHVPDCVLNNNKNIAPYLGKETSNPLDATWQRYHKPRANM